MTIFELLKLSIVNKSKSYDEILDTIELMYSKEKITVEQYMECLKLLNAFYGERG